MRILIEKLPELKAKLAEVERSWPSITKFYGADGKYNEAAHDAARAANAKLDEALRVAISEGEKQVKIQLALSSLAEL